MENLIASAGGATAWGRGTKCPVEPEGRGPLGLGHTLTPGTQTRQEPVALFFTPPVGCLAPSSFSGERMSAARSLCSCHFFTHVTAQTALKPYAF